MKSRKMFWVILAMILFFGCVQAGGGYWIKDEKEVLPEEIQKAYQECSGPTWVKDGVSTEDLEQDHDFCLSASAQREKHKQNVSRALNAGSLIPFVGVAFATAGGTVAIAGGLSVERCMKSKGYLEVSGWKGTRECMRNQGYKWKVTKD